jgi:hypothetical protein
MPTPPLSKIATAKLDDIRPRLDAPPAVQPQLEQCRSAVEALELLVGGGLMLEACRLFAHALPRREGVWWVCMCARHTAPPDLGKGDLASLDAAELWVRKPSDENRRAAFARAEEVRFGTPEAWASVAAFWSGDSMSPANAPAVPPAPHLAGLAIAGAVTLASVRGHPERQAQRLANFIESARAIADGGVGRLEPEQA